MGDRPPTNPAIRVRFSVVDEFFFRVRGRHLYATPINSNYSLQRKTINAIYWISRKRSLHSLAVRKGTYLQIGSMGRSFKRWASNHTTLLRNSTQTTLATWGGILRVIKLTAENQLDDWRAMPRAKWWDNKRKRITGWLAGHEIHLEIEDVLDKIK